MSNGTPRGGSEHGASSSARFQLLLDSLKEQYEQDVSDLRSEVARLQGAELRGAPSQTDLWSPNSALLQPSRTASLVLKSEANCRSLYGSEHLKLKDHWLKKRQTTSLDAELAAMDYEDMRHSEVPKGFFSPLISKDGDRRWRRMVLNPNTQWRTYWAFIGLGMVSFDLINVPLQAFEMPSNIFLDFMDWITLLFWTLDIVNSFLCGYYANGELVLCLRRIACNYLKGWFLIDIVVVGPDWIQKIFFPHGEDGASNLGRLLRGARAIRVLRLLRIMKLQRIICKLYDMIDNEYSFILAELMKMMLFILILNHFIACGWFLVGHIAMTWLMPTWITWSENFTELSVGYQYTTALHWTLTQFTPASMDVVARNIMERLYSIGVLLFAMVAFSSIVGTVTTSMTIIRQMKDDKQKQFWKLRRYLKQRNVSADLTQRMLRFVEYQCSKQEKTIQTASVLLLQRLSDQLSSELGHELASPYLQGHVFYAHLSKEMKGIAFRVCHMAIKSQQLATGDLLFASGEEADSSFILKNGNLTYTLQAGGRLDPPVKEKEWLAEAVLWTPWRYRGSCRAGAPSEILNLNARGFAEAMSNHPKSFDFARRYGERFVRYMNIGNPADWTDVLRSQEFCDIAEADDWECEEKLMQMEGEMEEKRALEEAEEEALLQQRQEEDKEASEDEACEAESQEGEELKEEEQQQQQEEEGKAPQEAAAEPGESHAGTRASYAAVRHRIWRIAPSEAPKTWVSRTLGASCFTPCAPCAP